MPTLAPCKRCGKIRTPDGVVCGPCEYETDGVSQSVAKGPVLAPAALIGLAGDVVRALAPFTEASEAAILADKLMTFGVNVGKNGLGGPCVAQGLTQQDTRENFLIVGPTAEGRKASSRLGISMLYNRLESPARVCEGVASGEALMEEFEDPVLTEEEKPRILFGHEDRRLIYYQSEFSQALIISSRSGSSLSPLLRDMWDKTRIEMKKVGGRKRVSTNFHTGVMGNITGEELMALMSDRDVSNGFANRFLYIWACRSKFIPFAPSREELEAALAPLVSRTRQALSHARTVCAVTWSAEARQYWIENYPRLSTIADQGMVGFLIKRRDMHNIRLALMYCLLDLRSELLVSDFEAAEALWDYSEATARWIVERYYLDPAEERGVAQARSDAAKGRAAKLLKIVVESPGVNRTQVQRSFNNNLGPGVLDGLLMKLADRIEVRTGPPETYWPRSDT